MLCDDMILVLLFFLFVKRALKLHTLHVERIYVSLQCALKMSENSSDSDSSCGWTVINHEVPNLKLMEFCQYKAAHGVKNCCWFFVDLTYQQRI